MEPIKIGIEQLDNIKIHHIIAKARTGSSLLATMLNQHNNILCVIEYPFGYLLYSKYHKVKYWTPQWIDAYCDDFFSFATPTLPIQFSSKGALKETLLNYCALLNYSRVIRLTYLCFFPEKDKSTITTIVNKHLTAHFYLKRLALYLPESKFILLRRLPIDNIARHANMRQVKNRSHLIQNMAILWRMQYKKRLNISNKIEADRKLIVNYEQLIRQQRETALEICQFLEVRFEDQMLSYVYKNNILDSIKKNEAFIHEVERLIGPLSLHEGVSKAPDASKIGAWVNQLSNEDGSLIWKICEPVATKMGMPKHPSVREYRLPPFFFVTRLKVGVMFYYRQLWYALPLSYKIFFRRMRLKFASNEK